MISIRDAFEKTANYFHIKNYGRSLEQFLQFNWIVVDQYFDFDQIDILKYLLYQSSKFIQHFIQYQQDDEEYLKFLYTQIQGVTADRFEEFLNGNINIGARFGYNIEFKKPFSPQEHNIDFNFTTILNLQSIFLTNPEKLFQTQEIFDDFFFAPTVTQHQVSSAQKSTAQKVCQTAKIPLEVNHAARPPGPLIY